MQPSISIFSVLLHVDLGERVLKLGTAAQLLRVLATCKELANWILGDASLWARLVTHHRLPSPGAPTLLGGMWRLCSDVTVNGDTHHCHGCFLPTLRAVLIKTYVNSCEYTWKPHPKRLRVCEACMNEPGGLFEATEIPRGTRCKRRRITFTGAFGVPKRRKRREYVWATVRGSQESKTASM